VSGAIIVLAVIVVLTFLIVRLVPGDPARQILGLNATPDQVSQLRETLGLDRPLPQQFADYCAALLHGNLGTSFTTGQPVTAMLAIRFPVTLHLALAGLLVVLLAGFTAGLVVGSLQHQGRARVLTRSFTSLTALAGAAPEYLVGTALILVFAVGLGVLPAQGGDSVAGLLLPALAVGLGPAAVFARIVRNEVVAGLSQDYVTTALSKRITRRRLLLRHVAPNVATSALTLGGLILVSLLGGTVITENVFNIPGVGSEVVRAIVASDYPEVQGIILVLGLVTVAVNLLVDLVLGLLDPRVLHGGHR